MVSEPTSPVTVKTSSLDCWLDALELEQVDFIKLDVEGGELSVLQGMEKLLASAKRPVILAEVQDIRTQPWGYPIARSSSFWLQALPMVFNIGQRLGNTSRCSCRKLRWQFCGVP